MQGEVLACTHLLRLLAISQLHLQFVVARPSIVGEQRDTRDGCLLQLFLGCTHTTNVNEESECVGLLVLMTRMRVVKNHELAAVAVRLL